MADAKERLEEIARIYDASRDFDGVLTGFAFDLLSPRLSGGTTLEMGCSSGVMTALLALRVSALDVVDGSRAYLDAVRERVGSVNTRYFHSLFEEFEPDRRYADILMARALEHVSEPQAVLRRAASWLGPEGQIHVFVPNALSFHRLVGAAMGILADPHDLSERDQLYGHRRVYDPDTLHAELQGAGLAVAEEAGVMLKFVPNTDMERLSPALWAGLYRAGAAFPRHGAEIYARCRPRSGRA